MKLVKVKDYNQMSSTAAQHLICQIILQPETVLGLATGSTPKGMYAKLIQDHLENGTSYKSVKTVNLDEYVGLNKYEKNSYYSFMMEHFFNHIDIQKNSIYIPNGKASDHNKECRRYDSIIEDLKIDIQILGIGLNGHIGFNEPGTSFDSTTHVINLATSTRKANARFFPKIEDVPQQAITMGIKSILSSKKILLLASGKEKAPAIKKLLEGNININFPASVLHFHKNVTLIADTEALSEM